MVNSLINLADIAEIKSRWNTSHECESCDKPFCGAGAALVLLTNGKERIICLTCISKYLGMKTNIVKRPMRAYKQNPTIHVPQSLFSNLKERRRPHQTYASVIRELIAAIKNIQDATSQLNQPTLIPPTEGEQA